MAFITWPLIIYDFPASALDPISSTTNKFLEKWFRVNGSASPEIFYLPEVGLNIKHHEIFLKCMQVVKHHILSSSVDKKVRFIFESRLSHALASKGKCWSPETTLIQTYASFGIGI